jgi:rhodanese-related sulfurtransferase
MNFIQRLFGKKSVNFEELIAQGAKVVDVRSQAEFKSGHAKGAVNIPLDQIGAKAKSLNKDEVHILCCKSGMRSASATSQLKSMGFAQVHNAGSWTRLPH